MKTPPRMKKREIFRKNDFEHTTGVQFLQTEQPNVNKVNLLKKRKRTIGSAFRGVWVAISKKATQKLKGCKIKFASIDWGGGEIAIEIHCDAAKILTETDRMAKIGSCGFRGNKLRRKPKMLSFNMVLLYRGWIAKVQWFPHLVIRGNTRIVLRSFDMARALKGLLGELTFGNMGAEIHTYVRDDSSDASYRVDSVNTVPNEKRLNGFLERVIERR